MFCWPLLLHPPEGFAHSADAPFVFIAVLPALIAVVLAELGERGIDGKTMAMLGVCAAIGAALRPLGAGTAGVETVFFLLVLAGRVYGPGFGYVLGAVTLFGSALLTGGVGPWLPFQMMAASWVGLGAGFLPPARGRSEIAMLAVVRRVVRVRVRVPHEPLVLAVRHRLRYAALVHPRRRRGREPAPVLPVHGHDVVVRLGHRARDHERGRDRACSGPAVLAVLRRAARRAAFGAPVTFAAEAVEERA